MQKSLRDRLADLRLKHNNVAALLEPGSAALGTAATALLHEAVDLGDHAEELELRHRLLGQIEAYQSLLLATELNHGTVSALLLAAATRLATREETVGAPTAV